MKSHKTITKLMPSLLFLAAMLVVIAFAGTGCNPDAPPPDRPPVEVDDETASAGSNSNTEGEAGPTDETEAAPAPHEGPERIISAVPALTEIVFALGEGDRLVAVSDFCKWPPEARKKPKIGAIVNSDYETMLALQPDLALLRPDQEHVARRLEALGIESALVDAESVEDVYTAIVQVGEILGREDRARELNDEIRSELAQIKAERREKLARAGFVSAPPRVLLVVGRNPGTLQQIYAAGTGAFLTEMLELAGARNVLEDTRLPWPVISKEAILKLDPDMIIDGTLVGGGPGGDVIYDMGPWAQMETLSAVRHGRITGLYDPHVMIPGPSLPRNARVLAGVLDEALGIDAAAQAAVAGETMGDATGSETGAASPAGV